MFHRYLQRNTVCLKLNRPVILAAKISSRNTLGNDAMRCIFCVNNIVLIAVLLKYDHNYERKNNREES